MALEALEELRQSLPEPAKDLKLNLQSVLQGGSLNDAQRWGVALASAYGTRHKALIEATRKDAAAAAGDDVVADAQAAAALMGMNNVYYRFRHMIGKDSYQSMRAGLRMNYMAKPATNKGDFELFSLAVSVINGCEMCVQTHEASILKHELTEAQVNDTVRIAATFHGVATALDTL